MFRILACRKFITRKSMKPRFGSNPQGPLKSSSVAGQTTPSVLALLLHPGIGIKRWAFVVVSGALLIILGVAFLLTIPLSSSFLTAARLVTLSGVSAAVRGLVFLTVGLLLLVIGARHIFGMFQEGALGGRQTKYLLQDLHRYRTRTRGPTIVAIGGGTGLATLLRGLKAYTRNITAVVTVADDGGSSGRLRNELAIPPPGDARNCLVALSEVEPLMERLMQYRFSNGEGLEGHSLGNLLLAALVDLEGGFAPGLDAAAQLLEVSGRVLPAMLAPNVALSAETQGGLVMQGESRIGNSPDPLKRVWLEPAHLPTNPQVIEAVRDADLIVIGPGSLYTSVIPNFLAVGLSEALQASGAVKIFVCNVATEAGETSSYDADAHFQAFVDHAGVTVSHIIANSNVEPLPAEWMQVALKAERPKGFQGRLVVEDVVDESMRTRHDSAKLASVVIEIARRPKASLR